MSHTKQTPILEYTDAELQSLTVPAGTITLNTTLSCLSYYTGQEWINSDDWESTYTTVLTESASWVGGDYDDSALQAASGNWDSTYTTVSANSASWADHFDSTLISTESANWDSTYTTVSANSGIWNGSSAIAWEDGNTGSLEIGTLDTSTQTGNQAVTIGYRTIPGNVASGTSSIAIGFNANATQSRNIAIGSAAVATGLESIAIGNGTSACQSTAGSSLAIGYNTSATADLATAVGFNCAAKGTSTTAIGRTALVDTNTTNSTAVGYFTKVAANSDYSTAVGPYTTVAADDIQEFGQWHSSSIRQAAVRCQGWNLSPIHQGMVCITALSSSSARTNAAGPADGSEARDTIPRGMYTIRRWGDDVYLDTNDTADNILTIPLDSTLGDSAYTTVSSNSATWGTGYDDSALQAASANWDSTYTTTSANSALWSGGGRVKWEDSINKLTIGDLDDDPIGNYAINIQTGRTTSTNKAVGLKAITIGYDNRAEGEGCIAIGPAAKSTTDGAGVAVGSVAIGDTAQSKFSNSISLGPDTLANGAGTIAIGNAALSNGLNTSGSVPLGGAIVIGQAAVSQSGYEDIVIGEDAESGLANGGQSVVIGKSAESYGTTSVAIGFDAHTGQSTSITAGAATAIGSRAFAVGDGSVSIGRNVLSYYDETGEIGIYQDLARNPVYTNADRKVGVRFDGSGMVSMSLLSAENAPSTRAAATDGFENVGELGPKMFNIRRWGDVFYLDANNPANNNIKTIPLNNSQQTITSSASALTLDVSLGHSATTTLTENITSFTIQNASAGDSGVLIISSDGGGWTFPDQDSLGSSHIIHTGTPYSISTLTSTTSSTVSIGWYCDGSRQFLYISDAT